MFTGLIDDVGEIASVSGSPAGREFRVRCRYDDLTAGESIAINGACLTVRDFGVHWFTAAAIETTLDRTTIGDWQAGRRVNLERAMQVGARFGGHIVQGHVDGVARVTSVRQQGDARLVDLALPEGLADLMVQHGSVAVDGVSLTVNDLLDCHPEGASATEGPARWDRDLLQVSLIDYTLRHTTLGDLAPGDAVHVEADVVGKYVQRLLRGADQARV